MQDVGAVLFAQNQLYTLAWTFYSDAIFSTGDDLETGIKRETGWKAFVDEVGLFAGLSKKDQTMKSNLIFMAVDKVDKPTASVIVVQARNRGAAARTAAPKAAAADPKATHSKVVGLGGGGDRITHTTKDALGAMGEAPLDLSGKADRQLSRVEFMNALVKAALEKYVRSKQNANNELEDVSDALEKLFAEVLEPALRAPPAGRSQPRVPLPDDFRDAVCYVETTSDALARLAPALRVIFAGLARITYEASKGGGGQLPKVGKSRQVRRAGNACWTLVGGLVSLNLWRSFINALKLPGTDQRAIALCFVCSIMCTPDGSFRERHLPFEGFLEALVRLTTVVPIPTDAQLESAGTQYAGTLLAALEAGDAAVLANCAAEQKCEWGDVPDAATGGAMHRRIVHLVDIVLRRIKEPKEADQPLDALTRRDFRLWALRNLKLPDDRMLPEAWIYEVEVGE